MRKDKYKNVVENNNITSEDFFSIIGGKSVGEVSKNNVLKNSSVIYACINMIASTISTCEINMFEENGTGRKKVINEISYLLNVSPNELITSTQFWHTFITNLLIFGNGYALIDFKKGVPKKITLLDSAKTTIELSNGKYFIRSITYDNKSIYTQYENVLHVADVTSGDGVVGTSRIDSIIEKINLQRDAMGKASKSFKEGSQIKGILNVATDLSAEAKTKLKSAFNNVLNSDSSGVSVLSNGIEYQNVASSVSNLVDNEFINSIKLTTSEIASIFGIPVPLLNDLSSTNYSNMQILWRNFFANMQGLIAKIEEQCQLKLLSREDRQKYFFRLDTTAKLRTDDTERANFYKVMIQNGLMTINECRAMECLEEKEGGDEIRASLNTINIKWMDEYQLRKSGADSTDLTSDTDSNSNIETKTKEE